MELVRLAWDSDFFGFPIGRLTISHSADVQAMPKAVADACDVACLYIFVEGDELAEMCMGQLGRNAIVVDKKLLYAKKLDGKRMFPTGVTEYESIEPSQSLESLAVLSGLKSRYFVDARFRPHYERLYKTWLRNSLSRQIADRVYVTQEGKYITGFVTCRKDGNEGTIGLIAISPDRRGQGLGSMLVRACECYYYSTGANVSRVVTQAANKEACSFYEAKGYHIVNSTVVLHVWRR